MREIGPGLETIKPTPSDIVPSRKPNLLSLLIPSKSSTAWTEEASKHMGPWGLSLFKAPQGAFLKSVSGNPPASQSWWPLFIFPAPDFAVATISCQQKLHLLLRFLSLSLLHLFHSQIPSGLCESSSCSQPCAQKGPELVWMFYCHSQGFWASFEQGARVFILHSTLWGVWFVPTVTQGHEPTQPFANGDGYPCTSRLVRDLAHRSTLSLLDVVRLNDTHHGRKP